MKNATDADDSYIKMILTGAHIFVQIAFSKCKQIFATVMIGRATTSAELCGAVALTSAADGAGLQTTSAIQGTEMNEDVALGLSVFLFLALVCLCIAWSAWKQDSDREDFLALSDTV